MKERGCPICKGTGSLSSTYDIEAKVAIDMLKRTRDHMFQWLKECGIFLPDPDIEHYTPENLWELLSNRRILCLKKPVNLP